LSSQARAYAEGLLGLRAPYRQDNGLPQHLQLAELEGIAKEVRQFVCACPRLHGWCFDAQDLSEVMQDGRREGRQG
jgi:hypothetical protein